MTLDKTSYSLENDAEISLTIMNKGRHSIEYSDPGYGIVFEIFRENTWEIYFKAYSIFTVIATLDPDEEITRNYDLNISIGTFKNFHEGFYHVRSIGYIVNTLNEIA